MRDLDIEFGMFPCLLFPISQVSVVKKDSGYPTLIRLAVLGETQA